MPARDRAAQEGQAAQRRTRRTTESADPPRGKTRRAAPEETRQKEKERAPTARRDRSTAMPAREAAAAAANAVHELTGHVPEAVTSLERDGEGWRVGVEVLESRRVPDSTDILAIYQVVLANDGDFVSCRRERRYHRGRPEQEST